MSTLLMRLAGPLQSWGVESKFEKRGTDRAPSKSGIIGMIAAAMGRRRSETIEDLLELKFGVRVDQEGVLLKDYQTVKGEKPYVTNRYYLSDAIFLVGLEGNINLLEKIDTALLKPAFPLYLGRRSCPPEGIVSLGIKEQVSLKDALNNEPWLVSEWRKKRNQNKLNLRILIDSNIEDDEVLFQRDLPISFNQSRREYGFRQITEYVQNIQRSNDGENIEKYGITDHDPLSAFEEE
ncbi:CRISPR system Cascade subunit CasD [Alkalibacter saccharofermentans DSM 14828]|uniref:CRISPR system Cascade subunit CasD n=2 Tax=Alkalibacter TaxID=274470 RepID=A0A1M4V9S2_9FIRM|nr:CRISPR system Cascade subunit CasD [Alkalibacter saccharofermentans DSM 14828]